MATSGAPEPLDPAAVMARLEAVEVSVQEIRFQHIVKVDAVQNGLGILYGRMQLIEQELTGFRAEAAAEFGVLKGDVSELKSDADTLKDDMVSVKDSLAEILRRLPPPADQ